MLWTGDSVTDSARVFVYLIVVPSFLGSVAEKVDLVEPFRFDMFERVRLVPA